MTSRTGISARVYLSDTWKIKPNLTVDYGVAWEYESGLFSKDLVPPAFLAPLYTATYGANSNACDSAAEGTNGSL